MLYHDFSVQILAEKCLTQAFRNYIKATGAVVKIFSFLTAAPHNLVKFLFNCKFSFCSWPIIPRSWPIELLLSSISYQEIDWD